MKYTERTTQRQTIKKQTSYNFVYFSRKNAHIRNNSRVWYQCIRFLNILQYREKKFFFTAFMAIKCSSKIVRLVFFLSFLIDFRRSHIWLIKRAPESFWVVRTPFFTNMLKNNNLQRTLFCVAFTLKKSNTTDLES